MDREKQKINKTILRIISKETSARTPIVIVGVLALLLLSACFTGVESTKKIEISKTEEKEYEPTPEDIFLADIVATPHYEWQPGKLFFVTDDRATHIFEPSTANHFDMKLGGKTLKFQDISKRTTVDGSQILIISFSDGYNRFNYNSGKLTTDTIFSDQIPMMIDLNMIERLKEKLLNLKIWTKSSIWYDSKGNSFNGKKYVPITIIDVKPGDKIFPANVLFTNSQGDTASMLMNIGTYGINSRSFANLFSLSDIRLKYSKTDDDVWTLIQNGEIQNGMTKQECILSLGNPKEVQKGHDYSKTLELWQYSDGIYLQFEDGILVNFRK